MKMWQQAPSERMRQEIEDQAFDAYGTTKADLIQHFTFELLEFFGPTFNDVEFVKNWGGYTRVLCTIVDKQFEIRSVNHTSTIINAWVKTVASHIVNEAKIKFNKK